MALTDAQRQALDARALDVLDRAESSGDLALQQTVYDVRDYVAGATDYSAAAGAVTSLEAEAAAASTAPGARPAPKPAPKPATGGATVVVHRADGTPIAVGTLPATGVVARVAALSPAEKVAAGLALAITGYGLWRTLR